MKKLFVIFLMFLVVSSYSQTGGKYDGTLKGQKLKGFLIDDKGDTIRGYFHIQKQYLMQNYPRITPDKEEVKNKNFDYKNVAYYEIENGTKWFSTTFTILKAPGDKRRSTPESLLHVLEFGPITMFDYNFYDDDVTPAKDEVKTYMQLPSGEVIDVASMLLGFKKLMSGYVKDYPELATKIANKEKGYGFIGIYDIVREYNKWYMEKHPEFTILKKK